MNAEFRKERKKMEKIRKHAPLPDCPVGVRHGEGGAVQAARIRKEMLNDEA